MVREDAQTVGDEWVSFPGGELEGKRPKALCPTCREALAQKASGRVFSTTRGAPPPLATRGASARLLCFQCYRAGLDRDRAIRDAGQLDTASDARFQVQLPLEPVDKPRLETLKVERAGARVVALQGAGRFVDKRRHAQIEARHALQAIADGLKSRQLAATDRDRAMALAIHAAELQLPEAWLPFVIAR
jgi:hypothetical protein